MPPLNRLELGRLAEELASRYLETNGYKVLEKNFRNIFGEIDIIAKDKKAICFIEVKARKTGGVDLAKEAVNSRKAHHISKVALDYLKQNDLLKKKARFDVVCVGFDKEVPEVKLIKDAFELERNYSY